MDEKFYVRMQDKFMSGWGPARGKRNIHVIVCDTLEQAEAVEKAAQDRSEMKYISIVSTMPRPRAGQYITTSSFWDLGGPWLSYCHMGLKEEIRLHKAAELQKEQELYAQRNVTAEA